MKDEKIEHELHLRALNAQVDFNHAAEEYRARRAQWDAEEAQLLDRLTACWHVSQKCRRHLKEMGAEVRDIIADEGMERVIADTESRKWKNEPGTGLKDHVGGQN